MFLDLIVSEQVGYAYLPGVVAAVPAVFGGFPGISPCGIARLAHTDIVVGGDLDVSDGETTSDIDAEVGLLQPPLLRSVDHLVEVLHIVADGEAHLRTCRDEDVGEIAQGYGIAGVEGDDDLLLLEVVGIMKLVVDLRLALVVKHGDVEAQAREGNVGREGGTDEESQAVVGLEYIAVERHRGDIDSALETETHALSHGWRREHQQQEEEPRVGGG